MSGPMDRCHWDGKNMVNEDGKIVHGPFLKSWRGDWYTEEEARAYWTSPKGVARFAQGPPPGPPPPVPYFIRTSRIDEEES